MSSMPAITGNENSGAVLQEPSIRFSLSVASPLEFLLQPEVGAPASDLLQTTLDGLLADLGLPGKTIVAFEPADDQTALLALRMNGEVCRYPDELPVRVYSLVSEQPLSGQMSLAEASQWLDNKAQEQGDLATTAWFRFLRSFCLEAARGQTALLVTEEVVRSYLSILPDKPADAELADSAFIDSARAIISRVVSLWVSVADREQVSGILLPGLREGRQLDTIAEELVALLKPTTLEIRFHPQVLRSVTIAGEAERDLFPTLRDGLYYELGLRLPDIVFAEDENLQPGTFAVKLNHLVGFPLQALSPEQRMVNLPGDTLRELNIPFHPAMNPVSRTETSIISLDNEGLIPEQYIEWSPFGHLVITLSAFFREKAGLFIDTALVENELNQYQSDFPQLVSAIASRFSLDTLARVLRVLASEGFSLTDLYHILEALLDFDFVVADSINNIVVDSRLPTNAVPGSDWLADPTNLASYVRSRFKKYLTQRHASEDGSIYAYLLSPEIEQKLLDSVRDGILAQVEAEVLSTIRQVAAIPAQGPWTGVFLTDIQIRPHLSRLVRGCWPGMAVLAYQELAPSATIQPLARIT